MNGPDPLDALPFVGMVLGLVAALALRLLAKAPGCGGACRCGRTPCNCAPVEPAPDQPPP